MVFPDNPEIPLSPSWRGNPVIINESPEKASECHASLIDLYSYWYRHILQTAILIW